MTTDKFTKEQFEQALPPNLWQHLGLISGEHQYTVKVFDKRQPDIDQKKRIVIRSSVGSDGIAKDTGNDSIRLWVEYHNGEVWLPLKKLDAWTTRRLGWDKRMVDKLRELWKIALTTKIENLSCPKCGGSLILRSGKYGDFYGCSNYPKCRYTKPVKSSNGNGKLPTPPQVRPTQVKAQPVKKGFTPSKYQQAIFEFIESDNGHLVVNAVAGSGKTTTIVQSLGLTKGKDVLFCAFNKHIQMELSSRVHAGNVQIQTIHSVGFATIRKSVGHKVKVDSRKLYNISKEYIPNEEWHLRSPACELASMAKRTLADYTDRQALEDLADFYGINLNGDADKILAVVPKMLKASAERLHVIDFDDMLWLPIIHNMNFDQHDIVFVDEAQDLSPAQLEIVVKSVKSDGRIIAVGDRHQAIYGFTGAGINSIDDIVTRLEADELPLSMCYRCGQEIVKLAQSIVPEIEAFENNESGVVYDINYIKFYQEVADNDLVVCRTNAPLIKVCYTLIRAGKKATIRGRDIGKGLINLIDKLEPTDITDLIEKVTDYERQQVQRLEAAGKDVTSIMDKCETMIALTDGVETLSDLRFRIEQIFDDNEKKGVILSSIHRSKGDEADRVFILHRELLPHPMAKNAWQLRQEANLEYVAYTRAKKELVFVN